VLEEDDEWGTTTMRLRLLAWLRSFTSAAGRSGVRFILGDALIRHAQEPGRHRLNVLTSPLIVCVCEVRNERY
jgi:hypothetical protein